MVSQDAKQKEQEVEIFIPPGPRLGRQVIDAVNLTKSYGDKVLFENVSFSLPPNAIVGIIGPNGAGKTTLFRIITGLEKPDKGEIRIGEAVKMAYVEQSREGLNDDWAVWQAMGDGEESFRIGGQGPMVNARAYASRFTFTGSDQQKKLGVLSGGERNRVHLARMLRMGANVLLLDEPTNDLDVNTIRALEEGLENFAGCAVIISHDRWFLDRVATHILAFEGDSQVVFFEGNFEEYERNKKQRLGVDADQPHRIKYRRLTK
jgi:ATPase subunit of ABC transporter with duplicated ATPase domains